MGIRDLVTSEASALAERLTEAMAAELEAATAKVQAAADASLKKVRLEAEQARAALEKAKADQKVVQARLQKVSADEQAARGELDKAHAETQTLRSAHDKAKAEAVTARGALEKARQDAQERASTVDVQLAEAVSAGALAQAERAKAVKAAEQALAAKAGLEKELRDSRSRLEAAKAERESMANELKRIEEESAEQNRGLQEQLQQAGAGSLTQVHAAFQRFGNVTSIADALGVVVDAMAGELARVALFRVNSNRLEGLRQSGFEFPSDISKIAVPLVRGSALTAAVETGQIHAVTADELNDSSRKLFGGKPSFVLIMPIAVGEAIEAIVYADNSGQRPGPATEHVRFAEVLLWHAQPLLARLSAEDKARDELEEYGAQLLVDLENVYNGDMAAGQKGEALQRHLQHNLEYARRMFEQQAESFGLSGSDLFDQQMAATTARQKSAPFGRDLAAAASQLARAGGQKLAAEA